MKLTKRDMEILKFINDFGFCETRQIGNCFDLKPYRVRRVMLRLMMAGLVERSKMLYERDAVYYLTHQGAGLTHLPKINSVSLGGYLHSIALVDVYLMLRKLHPDAGWVSERSLRHASEIKVYGARGHIADGLLQLNDKTIAVEVELTLKAQSRLQKILRGYAANFDIHEVWYFCGDSVFTAIKKAAANMSYIKVFSFEEFLESK